jgi:hypothetical protein
MLKGCRVQILRRVFQFFQQSKFKTLQLFVPNRKRLGATLSECTFSLKKCTSLERFLQDRTTSRLHFEKTRNKLDSSGIARETRKSSSSTMK